MSKRDRATICLDFDGVIHGYDSGWKGVDVIPDAPVKGSLEWMFEAIQVYEVAVMSARSGQSGGIPAMKKWLETEATKLDLWEPPSKDYIGLNRVQFPKVKPGAIIYIDDRGYRFCGPGTFPSLGNIATLKPWNK